MNYIHRLQHERDDAERRVKQADQLLLAFLTETLGPKFTGLDTDGGRKDWMATADIRTRIEAIRSTLDA